MRGVGIAAAQLKSRDKAAYAKVGEKSRAENMRHIKSVLETFKTSIEEFASKHREMINKDPEFRYFLTSSHM
jgi:ESCRT-II complex subunit VPS22